jgi:hypothetical protein
MGMELPSSWEPARMTGDEQKGYLSLDDGSQLRLELKWETPRRSPRVERVVQRYLNFLRRRARKNKVSVESDEDLKLGPAREGRSYFAWKLGSGKKGGASSACSLASVCSECKRVTLVHVLGRGDSRPRGAAERVFASFADHGEGGEEHWSVFGLDFVVPRRFSLTTSSFRAGACRLTFMDRDEVLDVARVAVGGTILRKEKFPDWLKGFFGKKLSQHLWDYQRTEFRGHLGLRFWGEEAPARGLGRFLKKPTYLEGWAWYCQDTDKILALRLVRGEDDEGDLARRLAGKMTCH